MKTKNIKGQRYVWICTDANGGKHRLYGNHQEVKIEANKKFPGWKTLSCGY